MDFWVHILNTILLFTALGASLNLLLGYTGLVSMSHAAFFGIGAYAAALTGRDLGLPFPLTLLVAVLVTSVLAAIAAIPALRVRGEYLILLTLALQMVVYGLMLSWVELTAGRTGISGIPRPDLLGIRLAQPLQFLPLIALVSLVVLLIAYRLGESPFGRVLKAIRDDEQATQALGKNVLSYKVLVFSISGGLAAVAGSIYAHYQAFINPFSFTLERSIFIVALVVLGGTANLFGTIAGAVLLVGLPEVLRFLQASQELVDALRNLVFGVSLVLFMRFRPEGLIPEHLRLRKSMSTKSKSEPAVPFALSLGTRGTANPSSPVLVALGLHKRFGGIKAANDFSMVLQSGKVTALVGPNGAGKTTVFNLLTGFLTPDVGTVVLQGRNASGLMPWQRARLGLARTFQDVRVFAHMTALDNVLVAIPRQPGERLGPLFFAPFRVARAEAMDREKALGYLRFVGLAERAHERVSALAFGEQKLVVLARVLATDADVLLLDEPAAGVDLYWVERMQGLIRQLAAGGKSVCIVEHNLEVVTAIADHVYFMEAGRILAEGRPRDLMADPRLAEIYFGTVPR